MFLSKRGDLQLMLVVSVHVQVGPKVGIQYIANSIKLLYNYFWPILYEVPVLWPEDDPSGN